MTTMEQVAKGLLILAKYEHKGTSVSAFPGIIYAGPRNPEGIVSPEDAAELSSLGWFESKSQKHWAINLY